MVLVAGAWLPGWTPGPDDDSAKWFQSGALFAALYIVALGTGGIKPNVSAFGADQLDVTDPQVHTPLMLFLQSLFTTPWTELNVQGATIPPHDICQKMDDVCIAEILTRSNSTCQKKASQVTSCKTAGTFLGGIVRKNVCCPCAPG